MSSRCEKNRRDGIDPEVGGPSSELVVRCCVRFVKVLSFFPGVQHS